MKEFNRLDCFALLLIYTVDSSMGRTLILMINLKNKYFLNHYKMT